jgi:hypothetical protein
VSLPHTGSQHGLADDKQSSGSNTNSSTSTFAVGVAAQPSNKHSSSTAVELQAKHANGHGAGAMNITPPVESLPAPLPLKRGLTKHVVTRWYRAPEVSVVCICASAVFAALGACGDAESFLGTSCCRRLASPYARAREKVKYLSRVLV